MNNNNHSTSNADSAYVNNLELLLFFFCLQGIGMGLVALATMARIWNDVDEQIYDRAYRLRHNKGQVRMDKFTYGSALAGGLVGMAATPNWSVTGGIQGASVGIGLAVFAHVLTSPKEKKKDK